MKKYKNKIFIRCVYIVLVIVIFLSSIFIIPLNENKAFSNSALLKFDESQYACELIAQKDPDITVDNEILTFDFSSIEENNIGYYGISNGKVTASYDFRNSGDTKIAEMGFSMITTLNSFMEFRPTITLDNQNIDYISYINNYNMSEIENLSFEDILSILNTIKNNDMSEITGELWTIDKNLINSEVTIKFDIDNDKSFFIYDNYLPATYNEKSENIDQIAIDINSDFNMFVVGDGISNVEIIDEQMNDFFIKEEITLNGYFSYACIIENINVRNLIWDRLMQQYQNFENNSKRGGLNINNSNIYIEDFFNRNKNRSFLFLMVYQVEISNEKSNMVTVSYNIESGFDAHYEPEIYKFNYLSNPAKNWEEFGQMTVNIITSEYCPYLINSNLNFYKTDKYNYSCTIDEVPDKNIAFDLCKSNNPKVVKYSNSYSPKIVIGIVAIVLIISIIYLIVLIIKKILKID